MTHFSSYAMPIDENQIRVHIQNFVDISCSSTSHHCVSIGMTHENENYKYLVYLSDNDGDTWDKTIQLTRPADETPDTENNNSLGIHCNESGSNCILIGTTYINKKRNIITYHSTDGGLNWGISNLIELPAKSTYKKNIDPIEPEVIFACGQNGTNCIIVTHTGSKDPKPLVYRTQDHGYTWTNPLEIKAEDSAYSENFKLNDINCSKSGLQCVVIGNYQSAGLINNEYIEDETQEIYTTQDGGSTWERMRYHLSPNSLYKEQIQPDELLKIACDKLGKKCIAMGVKYYQIIKQTQDYRETIREPQLYTYLSVDGGTTWLRTKMITQDQYIFPITSLSCDDEAETCIAAGLKLYPEDEDKADPIAYITYDSGNNWQLLPIQPLEKNSLFTKVFCDKSSVICHIVGIDEGYF